MTDLQKCIDFCKRMVHHLTHKPDTSVFEVSAYRKAAEAIEAHGSVKTLIIPGIGKSIKASLEEVLSGKPVKKLLDVEKYGPPYSVNELTRLSNVGPATAYKLYKTYGVKNFAELGKMIREHKINDPKLITAFYSADAVGERISRSIVAENIQPILDCIHACVPDVQLEVVGSFRRHRADTRDIDVLVGSDDAQNIKQVISACKKFSNEVKLFDKAGAKKAEIRINIAGIARKLDINFVSQKCWGSALLHFTGPLQYNTLLRKHAKSKSLKVSQYGVTNTKTNIIKRFATEEAMCEYLGVAYFPPECRDAVKSIKDQPKQLVELRNVIGDLHIHTTESDGLCSTNNLIKHFLVSRYSFLGISNHSFGTGSGLSEEAAMEYHALIRGEKRHIKASLVSGTTKRANILCGAEVDIGIDGKLAYSDKFLRSMDYVILAMHQKPDASATQRLTTAIKHLGSLGVPGILAHPTNRKIGVRPESQVEWDTVFELCVANNIALEINGQPERVDLPENLIRQAHRAGCVFSISSDFHGRKPSGIKALHENAVWQARRGGLARTDIINASTRTFKKWLGNRYDKIFTERK